MVIDNSKLMRPAVCSGEEWLVIKPTAAGLAAVHNTGLSVIHTARCLQYYRPELTRLDQALHNFI